MKKLYIITATILLSVSIISCKSEIFTNHTYKYVVSGNDTSFHIHYSNPIEGVVIFDYNNNWEYENTSKTKWEYGTLMANCKGADTCYVIVSIYKDNTLIESDTATRNKIAIAQIH